MRLVSTSAVFVATLLGSTCLASDISEVEFNRDIRPILSDTCFQCHGPDAAKRQADLRLDHGGVGAGRSRRPPGDRAGQAGRERAGAGASRRPIPTSACRRPIRGCKLTAEQIELLRRWIEQGAKWQPHWSFIPPARPPLPAVQDASWSRNPIDRFVLARLEQEGLTPSPEARPATLIRRADARPDRPAADARGGRRLPRRSAIRIRDALSRRLVDRLLASPRYGERMAARWLDAARYADTNGYQSDGDRDMWRWRDWVIDAFNAQPAVRPVHHRAARRRPAAERRRSTSGSPPASTATTAATPRAASSPRSTPSSTSSTASRRPRRSGSA